MADVSKINFGDGSGVRDVKDALAVRTVKVNGVNQTVSNNAVDLDIASNLITDSQWTALAALWAVE